MGYAPSLFYNILYHVRGLVALGLTQVNIKKKRRNTPQGQRNTIAANQGKAHRSKVTQKRVNQLNSKRIIMSLH
jgi:hypothetical protein